MTIFTTGGNSVPLRCLTKVGKSISALACPNFSATNIPPFWIFGFRFSTCKSPPDRNQHPEAPGWVIKPWFWDSRNHLEPFPVDGTLGPPWFIVEQTVSEHPEGNRSMDLLKHFQTLVLDTHTSTCYTSFHIITGILLGTSQIPFQVPPSNTFITENLSSALSSGRATMTRVVTFPYQRNGFFGFIPRIICKCHTPIKESKQHGS